MENKKILIIAEAGDNHNGSLKMAKQLIDVAAESKADIVKFQTFRSQRVVSCFAAKAEYQIETTGSQESQLEMIRKLELTAQDHIQLVAYCKEKKIKFLSTPFDLESLNFLVNELKVDMLKIPSGEITSGPLLLEAAHSGLPIILSTGMASLGEIEQALGVLAFGYLNCQEKKPTLKNFQEAYCSEEGQSILKENVVLLHCTTEYPAPIEEVNLKAMETLNHAFGLESGYSDHTEGIFISIAAAAMGAKVIEKHFTLDKNLPGPDHKASLEPDELTNMILGIRQVEYAKGSGIKIPGKSEEKNKNIARKSLIADTQIKMGEFFTEKNLTFKRPGNGISPMEYWELIGKEAKRDYREDEIIDHAN